MKCTNLYTYIARYLSVGVYLAISWLAAASPAHATLILDGNSNSSTFSNFSCSSCSGTSLTSTRVTFAGDSSGGTNSLLDIIPVTFSTEVDQTGLRLAGLSLYVGKKPDEDQTGVMFDYNLLLTFLTPSGGGPSQTFSVGITGALNGSMAYVELSGLDLLFTDPLELSGVKLSNFHFVAVDDGTGSSVFSGNTWTAKDDQTTAYLYLVADVAATAIPNPDPDPSAVPEPSTLTLFGIGLLGLTTLRRRKARG